MEQKLTQAFDALHMDDTCASRIECAMTQSHRSPIRTKLQTAIAICLVLVMVIALNPTVAQALEDIVDTITLHYKSEDQRIEIIQGVDKSGFNFSTGSLNTNIAPSFLTVENKDLYFTGNGEHINISDTISAEDPFTYVYEKDQFIHYIAIGGDYNPEIGISSVDTHEWIRDAAKMREGQEKGDNHAGWLGGGGRLNYLDEECTVFAVWYAKAIVELEIPWRYNDAKQQLESMDITE